MVFIVSCCVHFNIVIWNIAGIGALYTKMYQISKCMISFLYITVHRSIVSCMNIDKQYVRNVICGLCGHFLIIRGSYALSNT